MNRYKRKKVMSGCLVGFGVGIILVLFLPLNAWLCLISIALIAYGVSQLFKK